MPQFVPNGPIIPDTLVQALEEDRVVIFCGAGISMGAGLPSYRGLVEHCYRELTHPLPPPDSSEWAWPDRMLGALEGRYTPDRMRSIVADRLNRRPRHLELHRAILRLAQMRHREGLRLVTTNFDTFFEKARKGMGITYDWQSGPMLPIPRNDRTGTWRSVVYLHGRLGDPTLQPLVLTSADFGRAYLTEGWAARFVARLFADFTVLFVGYSLNDPVLRYMTDAFAAENAETRFAQPRGRAYIFQSYDDATVPDPQSYQNRNLEPIFYHSAQDHLLLRQTLVAWADARADYLASTASLIHGIASNRPDAIDPTDTANLLWAVAGRPGDNGHGAGVFAAVQDLPPIEWFDAFERRERELQAGYENARAEAERAERQPPFQPRLDISSLFPGPSSARNVEPTPVAIRLIPWLIRHLGTEGLVERVIAKLAEGRRPHANFRHAIRQHLTANQSLPAGYARFWWIVAAEGDWAFEHQEAYAGPAWVARGSLNSGVHPTWLKQEVLAALKPILGLSASSYRYWQEATNPGASVVVGERLHQLAEAEVRLSKWDHVKIMIKAINARPDANAFWASLLDELTSLTLRVFDLYAAVDKASETMDPSSSHRPSIAPHDQNSGYRDWTILFDLIWSGWMHLDALNAGASRALVARWQNLPYLAFRRLVLAAMNQSPHFSAEERLQMLCHG